MGKKLKIFFIDDDIALGHICTRIMQEEGYEVLYQTSLNGAKACIVETHPDMIVLDVEIGNKNGIEAVPELKAIAPNTPILFISSHTNSQLVVQALSAGAVAYLKKPLEIDELIAYIEKHLTEKITLKSTAADFYISERSVSRLFSEKMDVSFYRYVTQRRLIAAKVLILNGEPLESIGEQVGFVDYSTFYRAFKQAFSISPLQFKKLHESQRLPSHP